MPDIESVELVVREQLAARLYPYQEFALKTFSLVEDLIDFASSGTLFLNSPSNIKLIVLGRLQGDLRACWFSASVGYALPAMTVASSIHEIAFGAIYLNTSEDRAGEWLEHDNEKKQYPTCGHRQTIEATASLLSLTPDQTEQEYWIYRQLCWAKHGNPILQRKYGIDCQNARAQVHPLPHFSADTLRLCQFALSSATRPLLFLIGSILRLHVPEALSIVSMEAVEALQTSTVQQCIQDGIAYRAENCDTSLT